MPPTHAVLSAHDGRRTTHTSSSSRTISKCITYRLWTRTVTRCGTAHQQPSTISSESFTEAFYVGPLTSLTDLSWCIVCLQQNTGCSPSCPRLRSSSHRVSRRRVYCTRYPPLAANARGRSFGMPLSRHRKFRPYLHCCPWTLIASLLAIARTFVIA